MTKSMVSRHCSVTTNNTSEVHHDLTNNFLVKFYIHDVHKKSKDRNFLTYESALASARAYAIAA